MAILHTVEFWPQTGFVDAPWTDDPDEDAFTRSARAIGELYSAGIRPARVQARSSQLRLHCFAHEPGRGEVSVTVFTDLTEGHEMVGVSLPDGVATLSATARAALVLDVMHAAALRMAQARGWDSAAFEAARAHVVQRDLRYSWTGPAKTSPGRRYTARPACTIGDDGLGRVVVEIRRVADGTLIGASVPAPTGGAESVFRRVARTLRWRDGDSVRIDVDGVRITTLVEELPAMTVRREDADSGPPISFIGGATDGTVPEIYSTALHLLLDEVRTPLWVDWWSAAQDDVLEITYALGAAHPTRVTARRSGDRLRVTLDRPLSGILAAADRVALARADIEAVLATVRRRTGLGPHPDLPDPARLTTAAEAQLAEQAALIRGMRALLDSLADRLPGWLVTGLHGDLYEGRTVDTMSALRFHLSDLRATTTEAERAEFDAIAGSPAVTGATARWGHRRVRRPPGLLGPVDGHP